MDAKISQANQKEETDNDEEENIDIEEEEDEDEEVEKKKKAMKLIQLQLVLVDSYKYAAANLFLVGFTTHEISGNLQFKENEAIKSSSTNVGPFI